MAIALYGRTTKLHGPAQDWRRIIGAMDDDDGQSQFRTELIRRIAEALSRKHTGMLTIECDDGDVSVVEETARSINIDVDAQWPKPI